MKRSKEKAVYLKALRGISFSSLKDVVAGERWLYSLNRIFKWESHENDTYCAEFEKVIMTRSESTFIVAVHQAFVGKF